MKTVAITGATGAIGKAAMDGLKDKYALRGMSRSLDGTDLLDPDGLVEKFRGCDAVIHLGWLYGGGPGVGRGTGAMNNIQMHLNVLMAAKEAGVKRLIAASSVHADFFYDWMGPGLLSTERQQRANSLYGGLKLLVEAIDHEHASDDLRIADIRYGGVTDDGNPHATDPWERRVWLSHPDLCAMYQAILEHDEPPNYCHFYAVSDNEERVHDTANPFGWVPRDSASVDIRTELSP